MKYKIIRYQGQNWDDILTKIEEETTSLISFGWEPRGFASLLQTKKEIYKYHFSDWYVGYQTLIKK